MIGIKPKKKKNINTNLYDIFIGEKVQIVTNMRIRRTEQQDDSIIEEERPLIYDVYFLDMDEEFYYVGSNSDRVTSAIVKSTVDSIHLLYEVNMLDEVFENANDAKSELN